MPKISLFQLIQRARVQSLAIGGLTKNAGKTVVLNHVIRHAAANQLKVGITSIGLDGERQDTLGGHAKPQVWVPAGTYVATAANLVRQCPLDLTVQRATGLYTALGEVYLIQLRQSGLIELAGPSSVEGLQMVKEMLTPQCELMLFDGAFNRRSVMTARLSASSVVAIRPQKGYSYDKLGQRVAFELAVLRLTEPPARLHSPAKFWLKQGHHAVLEVDGNTRHSALTRDELLSCPSDQLAGGVLVYNGAVTDRMKARLGLLSALIVPDSSYIFLSQRVWTWLEQVGVSIYTIWPMQILALTINPEPPHGVVADIKKIGETISHYVSDLWVFDVQSGLSFRGGQIDDGHDD